MTKPTTNGRGHNKFATHSKHIERKRTDNPAQWQGERDTRSAIDRAVDEYLRTVPGSEEAAERMANWKGITCRSKYGTAASS